jgi:hypothetical protein
MAETDIASPAPNGQAGSPVAPPVRGSKPHDLAMILFSQSIQAQGRVLYEHGAPPLEIVDMLIEHACVILAGVEPAEGRTLLLQNIAKNMPGIVNRHHLRRNTTAGGVILPR